MVCPQVPLLFVLSLFTLSSSANVKRTYQQIEDDLTQATQELVKLNATIWSFPDTGGTVAQLQDIESQRKALEATANQTILDIHATWIAEGMNFDQPKLDDSSRVVTHATCRLPDSSALLAHSLRRRILWAIMATRPARPYHHAPGARPAIVLIRRRSSSWIPHPRLRDALLPGCLFNRGRPAGEAAGALLVCGHVDSTFSALELNIPGAYPSIRPQELLGEVYLLIVTEPGLRQYSQNQVERVRLEDWAGAVILSGAVILTLARRSTGTGTAAHWFRTELIDSGYRTGLEQDYP
ncbi:hypothetical protein C8J57DRAFT_1248856 [Mycena rebaudengoi]|nr:hypothetical protein C8J57DRAFT_1248856 [Mycena rebaudengoi]